MGLGFWGFGFDIWKVLGLLLHISEGSFKNMVLPSLKGSDVWAIGLYRDIRGKLGVPKGPY